MKNRGRTLILTKFVGVHPRNTHIKFEANLFSSLCEVKKVYNDNDDGHRVIATVALTH